MTTKTKETKKQGKRPTHTLYAKGNQHGEEVNIRLAALWNNPEKGYMGVSLENLELRENPNKASGEPPYNVFLNAKFYGQDMPVQVGVVTEKETKDGFQINLGDLVVFENKPREIEQPKKAVSNGQPRP